MCRQRTYAGERPARVSSVAPAPQTRQQTAAIVRKPLGDAIGRVEPPKAETQPARLQGRKCSRRLLSCVRARMEGKSGSRRGEGQRWKGKNNVYGREEPERSLFRMSANTATVQCEGNVATQTQRSLQLPRRERSPSQTSPVTPRPGSTQRQRDRHGGGGQACVPKLSAREEDCSPASCQRREQKGKPRTRRRTVQPSASARSRSTAVAQSRRTHPGKAGQRRMFRCSGNARSRELPKKSQRQQ